MKALLYRGPGVVEIEDIPDPEPRPGEVLLEDFITPMGLTRYRVAKQSGMQQRRIDEICAGSRGVTADTALRLARLLGTDAAFWMNLQAQYDLEIAERDLHDRIEVEVTPLAKAA